MLSPKSHLADELLHLPGEPAGVETYDGFDV
jgi:hypothetical protein